VRTTHTHHSCMAICQDNACPGHETHGTLVSLLHARVAWHVRFLGTRVLVPSARTGFPCLAAALAAATLGGTCGRKGVVGVTETS
jgi:hypothetical protein